MADARTAPTHLVLWDVDHTLISTGGVGRVAFAEAFDKATGFPLRQMTDPSGRTEGDIFRQTARAHGISDPEPLFPAFARHLAQAYETRLDLLQSKGRALAGAHAALKSLTDRHEIVQAVLTGNLHDVARVKLTAFGLADFIDWSVSAFAEDGSERTELVAAARERALNSIGYAFPRERTVLVGDTVNDVATALQASASIIAVASGHFTTEALRSAGATKVLASLEGPQFSTALNALLAEPER